MSSHRVCIDPEKLNRMRVEQGWGLEDVARMTGLGIGTLSDIETGKVKRPHPRTISKLVQRFGDTVLVSASELKK